MGAGRGAGKKAARDRNANLFPRRVAWIRDAVREKRLKHSFISDEVHTLNPTLFPIKEVKAYLNQMVDKGILSRTNNGQQIYTLDLSAWERLPRELKNITTKPHLLKPALTHLCGGAVPTLECLYSAEAIGSAVSTTSGVEAVNGQLRAFIECLIDHDVLVEVPSQEAEMPSKYLLTDKSIRILTGGPARDAAAREQLKDEKNTSTGDGKGTEDGSSEQNSEDDVLYELPETLVVTEGIPGVSAETLNKLWPYFRENQYRGFDPSIPNNWQVLGYRTRGACQQGIIYTCNCERPLLAHVQKGRGATPGKYQFLKNTTPKEWNAALEQARAAGKILNRKPLVVLSEAKKTGVERKTEKSAATTPPPPLSSTAVSTPAAVATEQKQPELTLETLAAELNALQQKVTAQDQELEALRANTAEQDARHQRFLRGIARKALALMVDVSVDDKRNVLKMLEGMIETTPRTTTESRRPSPLKDGGAA